MKRFILVGLVEALAFALTLVGAMPASAEASHTIEHYEITLDFVAPNPCTGELVHYEGLVEVTIQTTYTPEGQIPRIVWSLLRLQGIGLETGTIYSLESHYQESAIQSVDVASGIMAYTLAQNYIEVSRGLAGTYTATGVFHLTFDANGEPVSAFEFVDVHCVVG
jgi:hypothetical protein